MNSKNKLSLIFGTAGIPSSTSPTSTPNGIRRSKEIGAGAMEIEWVRGVRVSEKLAASIKEAAEEAGVVLVAHAPYFINLNSPDKRTLDESIFRVVEALNAANRCGVKSVALHAGFNHGETSLDVLPKIRVALKRVNGRLAADVKRNVKLSLETMGKPSQFGSLVECLQLAKEFKNVGIVLDVAHLLARTRGQLNSYDEFVGVFEKIKEELGAEALKNLHMHISGIEFGPAGERRHLMLEESKLDWQGFLHACKDMKVAGVLICESPNAEKDLKLLMAEWKKIDK